MIEITPELEEQYSRYGRKTRVDEHGRYVYDEDRNLLYDPVPTEQFHAAIVEAETRRLEKEAKKAAILEDPRVAEALEATQKANELAKRARELVIEAGKDGVFGGFTTANYDNDSYDGLDEDEPYRENLFYMFNWTIGRASLDYAYYDYNEWDEIDWYTSGDGEGC